MTLRALALVLAWLLHPGAERWARRQVLLAADAVEADPAPVWRRPLQLAILLRWMRGESDFGRLRHSSYASCDWGLMQIHGRPDLEGAEGDAESIRLWLALLHANARACGAAGALAGLSSGRCDRATLLAAQRSLEAEIMLARAE